MSGGGRHPSALDPVLSYVTSNNVPEYDFVIQIMGDFLAILFHTPFGTWADELFIWDWKRARLITVRLIAFCPAVTLVLNYATALKSSPFG